LGMGKPFTRWLILNPQMVLSLEKRVVETLR
jgi:hypothetical protein